MNHNSFTLPDPALTDLLKNLSLASLTPDLRARLLSKSRPSNETITAGAEQVLKMVNSSLQDLKSLIQGYFEHHNIVRADYFENLLATFQATQDAFEQVQNCHRVRFDPEISLQLDDIKYAMIDLKTMIEEQTMLQGLQKIRTNFDELLGDQGQEDDDHYDNDDEDSDEDRRMEALQDRMAERQLSEWDEE